MKIAILSPLPALRAGLRALLAADPALEIVHAAAGPDDLPAGVDVVVMTEEVTVQEGARFLEPGAALLLLSDDPFAAGAAAGFGTAAWGVLSPDANAEALQAAVRALDQGLVVVSPMFAEELLPSGPPADAESESAPDGPVESLTARETDVLRLLAQGLTNKQAALALGISEHTVKFHVSSLYSKLGASNRTEAVRKGARLGWIPL